MISIDLAAADSKTLRDGDNLILRAKRSQMAKCLRKRPFNLYNATNVEIVLAPIVDGQRKPGVELAPQELINNGIADLVQKLCYQVGSASVTNLLHDFEKVTPKSDPDYGKVHKVRTVGAVSKVVYMTNRKLQKYQRFVLTLGGDHTISIGSIAATGAVWASGNYSVIWVDAHTDINTFTTTETGNIHGMPLALVSGIQDTNGVPNFKWLLPSLLPNRLVYIASRSVDDLEKVILRKYGIRAFYMDEIRRDGIQAVVKKALDYVNPNRNLPIHLSFDIDAIDPSVAPSTGTPVKGGLTLEEGKYICKTIGETGLLVAMDMSEVNVKLDSAKGASNTVNAAISVIQAAVGSHCAAYKLC